MKAAIYIRVSTDKEDQKQSLENQQALFTNYLSERNWELYDFYIDVESGTKSKKREDLKRLIFDANENKFDIILAKELSRLARNGQLSYEIKNIAESKSIDIITLDGAIDTTSNNTHMFGLYAWIYEQESQRTSERIKAVFKTKAQQGEFLGSIPPYGYYLENKKLKVRDDFTPDVIKEIFRLFLSGYGTDSIARELTTKNIPTPSIVANKSRINSTWHGSTIRKILRNPHYIGNLVQNRETTISVTSEKRKTNKELEQIVIENTHEGIISGDDFERTQKRIAERSIKRPNVKKHLFSNLIFCADCGRRMHYNKPRNLFICGTFNKKGRENCSSHYIKNKDLLHKFSEDFNKFLSRIPKDKINEVKKKMNKNSIKDINRNSEINIEIEKLEQDKVGILKMKLRGEINDEEFERFLKDTREKIDFLKSRLEKENKDIEKKRNSIETHIQFIERILIKEDGTPVFEYWPLT